MRNNCIKSFVIVSLVFLFMGCSSIPKPKPSGFLGDYSGMVESEDFNGWFIEKNKNKNIGLYSTFMLAPIKIYFHRDAVGSEIDPVKLKEISDAFYDEIVEELQKEYRVVDKPGPGVLLIKVALTDVFPNKVLLNLHWSTTASGAGIGGASIEAEFLDSHTGERILAVMDSSQGKRAKYHKGLTKWGHSESMLKDWAKRLVEKLDEYHEGS